MAVLKMPVSSRLYGKEYVNEKDVMDTENDVPFLLSVDFHDGTAAVDKSLHFRGDKSF